LNNQGNALVIPAYNEEANIGALLDRVETVIANKSLPLNVFVIDDGCVDSTRQIAEDKAREYGNVKIVIHEKNKGFAAALKTGIASVLSEGYSGAIFMDCDQTHDPADVPAFIRELDKGVDVVIGSRYMGDGGMVDIPWHRILISKIGNSFGQLFFRLPVRDASSGYRALSRKAMESIKIEVNDFSIQVEEVLRARKLSLSFSEIPIILVNRKLGTSKFNLTFKALWHYYVLLLRSLTWR
jgi:dolichol-phosphate mannosyltransferase